MRFLHAAVLAALLVTELDPSTLLSPSATPPVISAATAQAEDVLAQLGIDGTIYGRVKSPESLHAKAARKGLRPDQILDRVGLRVLVDSVSDCYAVRDALAARYPIIDDSADDYIAAPKGNGYQSLHMAALTPFGVAEFQVRTHAMHAHAEEGAAAHWLYKQQA